MDLYLSFRPFLFISLSLFSAILSLPLSSSLSLNLNCPISRHLSLYIPLTTLSSLSLSLSLSPPPLLTIPLSISISLFPISYPHSISFLPLCQECFSVYLRTITNNGIQSKCSLAVITDCFKYKTIHHFVVGKMRSDQSTASDFLNNKNFYSDN